MHYIRNNRINYGNCYVAGIFSNKARMTSNNKLNYFLQTVEKFMKSEGSSALLSANVGRRFVFALHVLMFVL